ncbi:MAG: UDP-glucose 4-epimerase GalE [Acidobacteria bacterium]|nr:UDP-glucose 4-epimerase GalE [Acidobacteriota bacterium]MBI3657423.1 UDP-glucose 4-epimerase GalE [Acidobacteriota bacterium]
MKKEAILVAGGAGYIGSHAVKALRQSSFLPVIFDNFSTGHREFITGFDYVEGDLGDPKKLNATFESYRFSAVMHFASHCYVGESWENPYKYYHDNVVNALNLLKTMLDHDVACLVFSSTCAIYGNPVTLPMAEDHPQVPVNPYGESKLFIEKILRDFSQVYDLRYVALRYFNAAGADPDLQFGEYHDPETHLIPRAFDAVTGRLPELEVYGEDYPTPDGTCLRDYIHVTDLADAHILALEHLLQGRPSAAYNLGTGTGISVRQIIETIESVTHRKVRTAIAPRRAGDPAELVADPSKVMRELGWQPNHSSVEEIIRTAWSWHKLKFKH